MSERDGSLRERLLGLAQTGVREDTPRQLAKRITLTNVYCLITIGLMQPYVILFVLAGASALAAMIVPLSLTLLLPLYLNGRGQHAAGRLLMFVVSTFTVLGYSLALGFDAGIHLFFLPLSCGPLVVFGSEERVPRYACSLLAILSFGAMVISSGTEPAIALSETVELGVYASCALGALLLLMSTLANQAYAQERAERELGTTHLRIEAELGQRYQRLLAERQAMDAQLRLADRLAAVGTLAAGVAHEINNPLTYVSLNLELIERAVASGDRAMAENAIASSSDGVDRVAVIVRDLMTFSRGDEDTRGAVGVCQVLDASLSIAHSKLRHGGNIVRDYREQGFVWANEARLGQVFLNLLLNANQAVRSAEEGGEIKITVDRSADGERMRIDIEDNGSGIEPDMLPRIFDPFFTTKPVGIGTGLGLYITRQIVEEMDGAIDVQSLVGKGTRFRIELPTTSMDAVAPPKRFATESGRVPRLKILVVDDEPDVLHVLHALLDTHQVVTAPDGHRALARLVEDPAMDLVLSDVMMSPMSGMQFYERIRDHHPHLQERVVFMTGGAVTPDAMRFLAETPRLVVHKPVGLKELDAVLAEAAEVSAAEARAERAAREEPPVRLA